MKKRIFKVFTALVIGLAVLLVAACPGEVQKTDGFGYVTLNIGDTHLTRTIRPDSTDVEDSIESYKLTFTAKSGYAHTLGYYAGGTEGAVEITIENTSTIDTIALVPGLYDLKVIAYTEPVATQAVANAVAEGTKEDIRVSENAMIAVSVSLSAFEPNGDGEGTFSWDITFSGVLASLTAGSYTAEMEITTVTPALPKINLLTRGESTQILDSGYYEVTVTLEATDGDWGTLTNHAVEAADAKLTFTQALWVYQNMISHFAFDFSERSFGAQEVIFNFKDGMAGAGTETAPVKRYTALGGTVDLPTKAAPSTEEVYEFGKKYPFGTEYYTFVGWWTRDGSAYSGATALDFVTDYNTYWGQRFTDSTPVLGNIQVHAWWVKALDLDIDFDPDSIAGTDFELEISTGGAFTTLTAPSTDILTTVTTVTLRISNPGDFDDIKWYDSISGQLTPEASGDILITVGNYPFIRGFENTITIIAKDDDNNPESVVFKLNFLTTP